MFTCREARELLPRYVRGALSAEDFVEVRYHVMGCAACAQEVKQARQAVRLARSGCASVTDPAAEEVPELLLSDIVLVSHCSAGAK
jgi:anti-sigma factor RsiW